MLSDQELITNHLRSDKTAFPELLSRYLKPIFNFVYRATNNKQDADDISQEVFLKVWKNLKMYHSGSSVKTWIYAIARNTVIDWLRKKRQLVFSDLETAAGYNPLLDSLVDPELLPDELYERAEKAHLLESALDQLSYSEREVLILYYQHELTFAEIGEILKKPLDTVKSRQRRALIKLRTIISAPKL